MAHLHHDPLYTLGNLITSHAYVHSFITMQYKQIFMSESQVVMMVYCCTITTTRSTTFYSKVFRQVPLRGTAPKSSSVSSL